ncbi:hypothetical protein VKT23_008308 [Stygiomarasmius scandens]|uniref:Uncharacterized protein n=1 Tax=Marasmiellus scandens TaxID=2682957 RepID=A0ABR1JKC0_9AGAR
MAQEQHFLNVKKEIASSFPDFQAHVTNAWVEIIDELSKTADKISSAGPDYIPQVNLSELSSLSPEKVDEIRRKGTVVIRDVVDDADAISWKQQLKEFVEANPDIEGFPENDKQFFQL